MKIAYIPLRNAFDKNSWSGTDYYARICLEKQGHEVYVIQNYPQKPNWKQSISLIIKHVIAKIQRKWYNTARSIEFAKSCSEYTMNHLEPNTDAIFSLSTLPISFLDTKIPIFLLVDTVFSLYYEKQSYYINGYSNLCIKDANKIEECALKRCNMIFPTTYDTGNAIINSYKINKSKVSVVPIGPNFDKKPTLEEVRDYIQKRDKDKCKILFVGVDFYGKGADLVLETTKILNDWGFEHELHLCGLKDEIKDLPQNVINHGFISKNTESGINELVNLYKTSHLLFVPTRAEAYGLVFCEASAYGIPSISHNVGGPKTIIINDVNGQLFELGTKPEVFAMYIKTLFEDKDKYLEIANSSYNRFINVLNWDAAGSKYNEYLQMNIIG